jgi:hypothetical protein
MNIVYNTPKGHITEDWTLNGTRCYWVWLANLGLNPQFFFKKQDAINYLINR